MERDGLGVKITHEATRWDELFPTFGLRLDLSEDCQTAKLIYDGEVEDHKGRVYGYLDEAQEAGLMRQQVIDKLMADQITNDRDNADKIATRALGNLFRKSKARKKQEGNGVHYWLSKHVPEGLFDA